MHDPLGLGWWDERCGVNPLDPPDGMKWAISPACDPTADRPAYTFDDLTFRDSDDEDNLLAGPWLQIQAVRDIPEHGVKAGDLGGYLHVDLLDEYKHPGVFPSTVLSDSGAAWLGRRAVIARSISTQRKYATDHEHEYGFSDYLQGPNLPADALMVTDDALVEGTPDGWVVLDEGAEVGGAAQVTGNCYLRYAKVTGEAVVTGSAHLEGVSRRQKVRVEERAMVSDDAEIRGEASISGESQVRGSALVDGKASMSGKALACTDNAVPRLPGHTHQNVYTGTVVAGGTVMVDDAVVSGGTVGGNVRLSGEIHVFDNPKLTGTFHGAGGVVGGEVLCSGGKSYGTITGDSAVRFTSGTLDEDRVHDHGTHTTPRLPEEQALTEWERKVQQLGLTTGNVLLTVPPVPQGARRCMTRSAVSGLLCTHPVTDSTKRCAAGHRPQPVHTG